jgi:hypothetical protein
MTEDRRQMTEDRRQTTESRELEYFELRNREPARRVGVRRTISNFQPYALCSMLYAQNRNKE